MISLAQAKEPYVIELPYGLEVTVDPLTTAGMAMAQAAVRKRLGDLETQYRDRKEAGMEVTELPDLSDEPTRDGLYQSLLIKELAAGHITKWTGIEDDPPVTRENIVAVMELYPVGERFFQEFTLRQVLLNAAKNASGLSAAGISKPVEGPNIAKPAKKPRKKLGEKAATAAAKTAPRVAK